MSHTLPTFHATTVLCVRRGELVAIGGDGQVTMQNVVAKADAVKVRRLADVGHERAGVLVGFAGSVADAFSLFERFEAKLNETPEHLKKAAVELAKLWRTDRVLRRLESLLVVADKSVSLMISGGGEVIEPGADVQAGQGGSAGGSVVGIGSGGDYATAAARALLRHTSATPRQIVEQALTISGQMCIYSNTNLTVLDLVAG